MAVKGLEKGFFLFLHKGEVWAVRGPAFYTTEQFQQPGSGGQFAMCPCTPHRVITRRLEHMAREERVLKPGRQTQSPYPWWTLYCCVEPAGGTVGWDWGRGEAQGREGLGAYLGLASDLRGSFRNFD